MAAVLKVTYQDQTHRVQLPECRVSYEGIIDAIQELYPSEVTVAKYLDDENDLCTFCEASLPDFVNMSAEVIAQQGEVSQNDEASSNTWADYFGFAFLAKKTPEAPVSMNNKASGSVCRHTPQSKRKSL